MYGFYAKNLHLVNVVHTRRLELDDAVLELCRADVLCAQKAGPRSVSRDTGDQREGEGGTYVRGRPVHGNVAARARADRRAEVDRLALPEAAGRVAHGVAVVEPAHTGSQRVSGNGR